jgi:hypothetical protein
VAGGCAASERDPDAGPKEHDQKCGTMREGLHWTMNLSGPLLSARLIPVENPAASPGVKKLTSPVQLFACLCARAKRTPPKAITLTYESRNDRKSNNVSNFDHNVFAYHRVKRGEKEWKGIHYFGRAGTDEAGIPLNLDQLTAEAAKNESFVKMLADTNRYPVLTLEKTESLAQVVLSAVRPHDSPSYTLTESWREAIGTTALPFYTFIFPKLGEAKTEPFNLMRDETVIRFKSTTNGVVLDFFEDTSVGFIGKGK